MKSFVSFDWHAINGSEKSQKERIFKISSNFKIFCHLLLSIRLTKKFNPERLKARKSQSRARLNKIILRKKNTHTNKVRFCRWKGWKSVRKKEKRFSSRWQTWNVYIIKFHKSHRRLYTKVRWRAVFNTLRKRK